MSAPGTSGPWHVPPFVLAGLELAINRYLKLDPGAGDRFGALAGRVIALEFKGVNLTIYAAPSAAGLQFISRFEAAPDVTICGAPLALMRLAQGGRESLLSGEVEVTGDVELGQRFQQILGDLDIDWEEQLSHVVGDVAAHQAGNLVRSTLDWCTKAFSTLGQDLSEYLQEETHTLPDKADVDEWLRAVDVLRDDTERLEARVARLQRHLAQGAR